MTVHLNRAAAVHARSLIESGKVDKDSTWSFEASDGDALLGTNGDDWVNYARWFLGEDTAATPKTRDRYAYPVGKDGTVYRSALIAIRQRAGQQGAQAVFDEAGTLVALIDGTASAHSTFTIRAQGADQPAEVFIYGDIGDSWDENAVEAASFVRDLSNIDAAVIDVRINSYGGAVSDGLAIYNALKRHPATVNTHIDGVAISCASLIAMAGDTVAIAQNAVMMVHGPMAMAAGNAHDLRETADVLDKYAAAMAPAYAAKTGKPVVDVLALLTDGKNHWFTAAEANAFGLADEVSAAVAVEAKFALGRYRGLPAAAAAFSHERTAPMPLKTPAGATDAQSAQSAQPAAGQASASDASGTAATAAPASASGAALAVVERARAHEDNLAIREAFAPFLAQAGVRDLYEGILVDPRISVDAARAQLLKKLGDGAEPANPRGAHVTMGLSEREKTREAIETATLARAGLASPQMRATLGANPHRGARLLDIARGCLAHAGIDARGLSQLEVVAQAFTQSTSDFPIILENVMHKALQAAYAVAPDTWKRWCAIGSVSDFRASNRYRLGSFANLDSLNELGEFHNKTIPDGEKAAITAATKGNVINLSRQAVINDDLGAFVGLAAGLGRAAARTVEADAYALLAQNSGAGPTMTDGYALFSTQHNNLAGTGAVPGVATIAAGRTAMASQKDVGGNDYLDLAPMIFLSNIGNGDTARVTNDALYDTDVSSKFQVPNKVKGMFREVVGTPRVTTTDWYMFADPTVAPVIEVAFLDGNQEPYIELQQGFEVDGARYKVRLDYGVGAIDYRGGYRNAGS